MAIGEAASPAVPISLFPALGRVPAWLDEELSLLNRGETWIVIAVKVAQGRPNIPRV